MDIKSIILRNMPNVILKPLCKTYYFLEMHYLNLKYYLHHEQVDPYNIPIYINNYNRLSYLKELIGSLEKRGYTNIHIIDNQSTYPPLLEYYKRSKYDVIYLNENLGFRAIWESDKFKKVFSSYYVYTDSDMKIDDNCPSDFMSYFMKVLKKFPTCQKVGFSLSIDDLPNEFQFKEKVIKHESQYWNNKIEEGLFRAPIDTTFALYRPYTGGASNSFRLTIRTDSPYIIKHLPWYCNSSQLSDEDIYYANTISKSTHWSKFNK